MVNPLISRENLLVVTVSMTEGTNQLLPTCVSTDRVLRLADERRLRPSLSRCVGYLSAFTRVFRGVTNSG
jgi:hypothetical protein